jgi:hypothetical protein
MLAGGCIRTQNDRLARAQVRLIDRAKAFSQSAIWRCRHSPRGILLSTVWTLAYLMSSSSVSMTVTDESTGTARFELRLDLKAADAAFLKAQRAMNGEPALACGRVFPINYTLRLTPHPSPVAWAPDDELRRYGSKVPSLTCLSKTKLLDSESWSPANFLNSHQPQGAFMSAAAPSFLWGQFAPLPAH